MLGNWAHSVALPFQVLALGGTPIQLGSVAATGAAVSVVAILFGGALVDRLPRRTVILGSDLACGFAVATIAGLGLSGHLQIWHLYVEAAFFGAALSLYLPAMGAIIPELVPDETLLAANAVRGLSRQATRVAGPVLAGFVVAFAGPPVAFAGDALTFFVSFAALYLAGRPPPATREAGGGLVREVVGGIRFTFSIPWLWITIFGFALINAMYFGPLIVVLPLFVRGVLHADARVFGLITAGLGAGEVAGSFLVTQLPRRRAGPVMYLAEVVAMLGLAGLGLTTRLPLILACCLVSGAGLTTFQVLWESSLQRHVPRHLLGRVTAVDYFGALLLGPVAPLAYGLLVQSHAPGQLFLLSGLAAACLCLLALLVPAIRRLD